MAIRNFRRILTGIDVAPLLAQVDRHPELWNADPLWMRYKQGSVLHAGQNIPLRFVRAHDWNRPAFEHLYAARRIVDEIVPVVGGAVVGNLVVSRLPSMGKIPEHIDLMPDGIAPVYQRYQIPLRAAPGVIFWCGGEHLEMEPGEVWWFDNQKTHRVENRSDRDRISMFCDIHIPVRL